MMENIYVGTNNYLYSLNPDGTLNWKLTTNGGIDDSPALGVDGTIYLGIDDPSLIAVNPDGTMKWESLSGFFFSSSPAVAADGTIYIADALSTRSVLVAT